MMIVARNPIELMRIKLFEERSTLNSRENQSENPVKYLSAR
jgi:hypothetical protein